MYLVAVMAKETTGLIFFIFLYILFDVVNICLQTLWRLRSLLYLIGLSRVLLSNVIVFPGVLECVSLIKGVKS